MSPPSSPVPSPPFWLRQCARVVRRLPRVRYWMMNWPCRRGWWPPVFIAPFPDSAAGLRFECDLRNSLAREVFFTGRYEPQEAVLIPRLIGPGGTFVDVGAHWGYFSLMAAERVGPTGRVVAIEADPRIYATLARNLALNALPGTAAIQAAAEPGTPPMIGYDERGDNWGISRVARRGTAVAASYEVLARPVDGLHDELGVAAVDLIKIDIEGAEALALRGMDAGRHAHRYRRILIELHPAQLREHGTGARDMIDGLLGAGYRGWVIAHSAAETRQAAYDRGLGAEDLVRPLGEGALDDWPHLIFAVPDVPLFVPAGGP